MCSESDLLPRTRLSSRSRTWWCLCTFSAHTCGTLNSRVQGWTGSFLSPGVLSFGILCLPRAATPGLKSGANLPFHSPLITKSVDSASWISLRSALSSPFLFLLQEDPLCAPRLRRQPAAPPHSLVLHTAASHLPEEREAVAPKFTPFPASLSTYWTKPGSFAGCLGPWFMVLALLFLPSPPDHPQPPTSSADSCFSSTSLDILCSSTWNSPPPIAPYFLVYFETWTGTHLRHFFL